MRIVSVVGARPQFIKLKPVHDAVIARGHDHVVVHTGQHYDANMSQVFFDGLNLPDPQINLEVGSGRHSDQVAMMMERLSHHLEIVPPDWLVVYGDTNSTLAAALVGAKEGVPVAHVEAGLRSRNRRMPEEINRVLVDHASDVLLAPTPVAMDNLQAEGLAERSHLVGDVMSDLLGDLATSTSGTPLPDLTGDGYVVATIHRASNTDDPEVLESLIQALGEIETRVVLVAHPRLRSAAASAGLTLEDGNIVTVAPVPYLDMMALMRGSQGVVTDSGGLQKEAFLLGVACTTLRAETEWPETLVDERNILDPTGARLGELAARSVPPLTDNPYGDGRAATHIVECLEEFDQLEALNP